VGTARQASVHAELIGVSQAGQRFGGEGSAGRSARSMGGGGAMTTTTRTSLNGSPKSSGVASGIPSLGSLHQNLRFRVRVLGPAHASGRGRRGRTRSFPIFSTGLVSQIGESGGGYPISMFDLREGRIRLSPRLAPPSTGRVVRLREPCSLRVAPDAASSVVFVVGWVGVRRLGSAYAAGSWTPNGFFRSKVSPSWNSRQMASASLRAAAIRAFFLFPRRRHLARYHPPTDTPGPCLESAQ